MSVKLLVIVITVYKRYPSTYSLMQGSCFICTYVSTFKIWIFYFKIRITTFKYQVVL